MGQIMSSGPKVAILMGMYNGSTFVAEQLSSFTDQTHNNWLLVVSDDGSTDSSVEIVQSFARQHKEHKISVVSGPAKGFAANYLRLLEKAPRDAEYFAFSDQDDFWLPEKLERAIGKLKECSGAALICGRTITADNSLQPIGASPLFTRGTHFGNALVQSIAGGNTMVFNREALELLRIGLPFADRVNSHDWWCYQVLSGLGATVIYDEVPMILYRQHDQNLVGANTGTRARLKRLLLLLQGRFRAWSSETIASLSPIKEHLTDENLDILLSFEEARGSGLMRRVLLMRESGVYRQTLPGRIGLWVAVLFNLI